MLSGCLFVLFGRGVSGCQQIFGCTLICEILDVEAIEVVGVATHYLSLPSLIGPGAVRNVPPVPPPRRKSHMYQKQECVSNSDNCMNSRAKHELLKEVELEDSRRARSSEDLQSPCIKADPCLRENNNIQATGFNSSVDDSSFSVSYTQNGNACVTVPANCGIVVLPVKPLRHKQQAKKELLENAGSSDGSEISDMTVICVPKMESVDKCESSTAEEDKATFPQPKPRTSLLRKSTCFDVADQSSVAVQRSSALVPSRPAPCPPLPVSKIVTHSTTSMVPSRAAPPPPVPMPKIRTHSPGSPEVLKYSHNCDISPNKASSDSDNVSDSIQTPSLSGGTISEGNHEQLGNNEVFLPDSVPPEDSKSNSSGVSCPNSTSTVVLSPAVHVAVERCKRKGPAVPKKKPKPPCRRSLDTSSGTTSINSHTLDTRRQSESTVHGNQSSSLHSSTSDAADHSSLKPYPRQNVAPRFASVSVVGDHETADEQKDSSPRESCSSVSACSELDPAVGQLALTTPEIYVADTPPITPAAIGFDHDNEEERTVCNFS